MQESSSIEESEARPRVHHTQIYKVRFESPVTMNNRGRQNRERGKVQIHENEYNRFRKNSSQKDKDG